MRVDRRNSPLTFSPTINSQSSTPTTSIGLVDYGSGNLRSACKAFEVCGAEVVLVQKPDQLDSVGALVVPGQGAFHDCARNLRASGLWDPIKTWIAEDRPFFGICVGYQLLFERSEESPGVEGLGIFRGVVRRFPDGPLKVPHMGWNTLQTRAGDPLYAGLGSSPAFYFVHSFFPDPADSSIISATCEYGARFAAGLGRGRVHATQFHPEKSQQNGLAVVRNFIANVAEGSAPSPSSSHAPVSGH